MTESHSIEAVGRSILTDWLTHHGRKWSPSDLKTYDLIVDGQYAELKTKKHSSNKFDFIWVSEKTAEAIEKGQPYRLFLVCNVADPANVEIFEIPFSAVDARLVKTETWYSYSKKALEILHSTGER